MQNYSVLKTPICAKQEKLDTSKLASAEHCQQLTAAIKAATENMRFCADELNGIKENWQEFMAEVSPSRSNLDLGKSICLNFKYSDAASCECCDADISSDNTGFSKPLSCKRILRGSTCQCPQTHEIWHQAMFPFVIKLLRFSNYSIHILSIHGSSKPDQIVFSSKCVLHYDIPSESICQEPGTLRRVEIKYTETKSW
ncbi:Hypothetical predicted protein [Octopus vulgaris]|uniref:Uncharacterized protein n=1 Tax=Octopus vulgaris TaxID=6645 RepID=A0AA36BHN5_OCTVU|nr:Hypothetical predicted protein [Octopus vulgaris]